MIAFQQLTAFPDVPSDSSHRSAGKPLSPVQEAKLRRAAAEFESILLSSFWKSMKDSLGSDEEDATDPAHGSLDDLGIQSMSSAIGKAGGLGIGRLILKHLAPDLDRRPGLPDGGTRNP